MKQAIHKSEEPGSINEKLKDTNEELGNILDLAIKIQKVQQDRKKSKKEKGKALVHLLKENKRSFFKMLLLFLKRKLWTERGWPARLAIIGLIPGAAKGGSVGLATMGFGVGIPFFLLTVTGGMFIGTIIEEIQKEISKR